MESPGGSTEQYVEFVSAEREIMKASGTGTQRTARAIAVGFGGPQPEWDLERVESACGALPASSISDGTASRGSIRADILRRSLRRRIARDLVR